LYSSGGRPRPGFHKRVLKERRIYALKRSWIKFTGDYIKITKVTHQRLKDVTEEEAKKEGFNTLEEFKATWIRINGSWDPDTEVVVYDIELTEPPPKQTHLT
jgi:hypothetical protein